jgi:3-hydroxyacyl-[acyl-carrier-protein] dehydratase
MSDTKDIVDIQKIMKRIPHRYPFLLVDKVIDLVPGESAIGIKNVTMNEPQFMGHFPDFPVMPGVLIVEAMAQTAAIVVCETFEDPEDEKQVFFMSIDEARFRKPVVPGDQMKIHVSKVQARKTVWKFKAEAKVGDVLCAEATYAAMIMGGN